MKIKFQQTVRKKHIFFFIMKAGISFSSMYIVGNKKPEMNTVDFVNFFQTLSFNFTSKILVLIIGKTSFAFLN